MVVAVEVVLMRYGESKSPAEAAAAEHTDTVVGVVTEHEETSDSVLEPKDDEDGPVPLLNPHALRRLRRGLRSNEVVLPPEARISLFVESGGHRGRLSRLGFT